MSFRPVYNPGNDIIQAYLQGHAQAQEKAQFEQKTELEKERLKQEKELAQEQLKQQHDLQTRQLDLVQAAHELEKLRQTQEIESRYHQTGDLPSGSTVIKPSTFTPDSQAPENGVAPIPSPISQTPGLGVEDVKLNIPGLGSTVTQTPEAASERAGQLEVAREEPKFRLAQQAEAAKSQLALELEDKRLKSQILQNELARQTQLQIAKGNNAATVTAAHIRTGGALITDTLNKFDTHDITKRFNVLRSQKELADAIPDNSTDPVAQRDLLYAFARAQNPQNVITSGELQTVQSGIQSIADSLGLKVDSIMGAKASFLTPAAIKSIKGQIANRYKLENTAFQNLKGEMSKRVKALGGEPDWLTDYSGTSTEDKMIDVQIPGQKPGQIHSSQLDAFKTKYPNAIVLGQN